MHSSPVVRKVALFLDRHAIAPGGMVVAVSGGPDSMALLRALLALRREWSGPLVVAHLNHQLRGAESDADEAFVRAHVAALQSPDLELCCTRIAVAALARAEGANLESAARRARYDWLTGIAREHRLSWIATGHTADDQAETVLHHLIRGTGLKGLRGIAPRRKLKDGIEVLRPLLTVTRAEVLAYLDEEQQPFRHDTSNDDLTFTRNRIRAQLLPLLAGQYNPRIVEGLGRLAEQAEEQFAETEQAAARLLAEAERPRADQVLFLAPAPLAGAPRNLVRETFRLLWEREGWPLGGMSFAHWDRLAQLVRCQAGQLDLPGGVTVSLRPGVLRIFAPSS